MKNKARVAVLAVTLSMGTVALGQYQPSSIMQYRTYAVDDIGNVTINQTHYGGQTGHVAFGWGNEWTQGIEWKWTGQWNETRADTRAHTAQTGSPFNYVYVKVDSDTHDYVEVTGPGPTVQVVLEVTSVSKGWGAALASGNIVLEGRFGPPGAPPFRAWDFHGPAGNGVSIDRFYATLNVGGVYELWHHASATSIADGVDSNGNYSGDCFQRAQQGIQVRLLPGQLGARLRWFSGANYERGFVTRVGP